MVARGGPRSHRLPRARSQEDHLQGRQFAPQAAEAHSSAPRVDFREPPSVGARVHHGWVARAGTFSPAHRVVGPRGAKAGAGVMGKGLAPLFLLGALGSAACSRHPPSDVTESASTSAPPAAASGEVAKILNRELLAADETEAGDAEKAVIDAVRREAWDDAWTAIDALPEAAKKRPAMRLLRARIAMS